MNIGKAFRKIREANKIGQREMSRIIGVTPATLWKIESGKCWPKPQTIKNFSKAMRVPIAMVYIDGIEPDDYLVL